MDYHPIEAFGRSVGTLPLRRVTNGAKTPKRVSKRHDNNTEQEFIMSTSIKDDFPNWKKAVKVKTVVTAYDKRKRKDIIDAIDFDKLELPEVNEINAATLAEASAIEVSGIPVVKNAEFVLDLESDNVKSFLEAAELERVKNISEQAEKLIKTQYANGLSRGIDGQQFARELKQNIGLNNPQVKTLDKYRAQLEDEGLTKKQVEKLVDKRRDKMLTYRSQMIARTETTRASAYGVQETGNQIVSQDLFTKEEVYKDWISIMDNRTTVSCQLRDEMEPILIDELFPDPSGQFGEVEAPPGHAGCRADMTIEIIPKKSKK